MDAVIRRLAAVRVPAWTYDAGLVLFGVVTFAASWILSPGADPEWVYLPDGQRFGDTCLMLAVTGLPCPQCGMTRAFVLAARGDLVTAFLRNPAGLALFLWILAGAGIGAVRLVRGNPRALRLPQSVFLGWALFWLVGLYVVPYALRLVGVNPLP